MSSFSEFLEMGAYAAFVWPAFGITAVIMIALAVQSWIALKNERATLDSLQAQRGDVRNGGAAAK